MISQINTLMNFKREIGNRVVKQIQHVSNSLKI